MNHRELARKIYTVSNIRGNFVLRSGKTSTEYFDKYLFESVPEILENIAREAITRIPKDIDYIAGLELGGIPIATMISHYSRMPTLFIRKQAKEYGTCKCAEGGEINGKRILIIEDVVSTGGAIIDGVAMLRKAGGIIQDVICVIDRESGGKEKLKEHGLNLIGLFTKSELESAT
ncbi:MAG: orotate phosphoribosyltransferase [Spirochaetes bacterium]|nr:orotate phosphoribosyltransferase [Spirochaetota bacterium]